MALSQWKEAILEGIYMEIKNGVVEEKNLDRFEDLVEILHKEGSKVPESVKQAYCQVAVECTAKYLANDKNKYTEAIRSIWLRRIMPLCDKVSCLVTRDLLNSCRVLWTAHNDEKACKSLIDENTKEKALVSLRKVVSELHPNFDDRNDEYLDDTEEIETSEESGDTVPMDEDVIETEVEEECKTPEVVESPPKKMKTIATAVVDKTLRELRAAKMDLVNALERGEPSNLNNDEMVTEREVDVSNPSAMDTRARPTSLMERRSTAQTYEWKDSIDDFDGEMREDGGGRITIHKKVVTSPSKRRKIVPWCTAETLAVLKGYEKYGPNWKLIKDECPILARRTNGDIKDKFRVEMRREERRR